MIAGRLTTTNIQLTSIKAVTSEGKVCPAHGVPDLPLSNGGSIGMAAAGVQGNQVYLAGGRFNDAVKDGGEYRAARNSADKTGCNYVLPKKPRNCVQFQTVFLTGKQRHM